ncbi:unnamed protein product, partial [Ixodes persulcatus]
MCSGSSLLCRALEYVLDVGNINLSAIRTIRVLRPLRAINRIPSMRILVMLLLDTLPMLGNVLLLCFFVFFIFGIVGVQLWAGLLRQRCYLVLPDDNVSIPSPISSYYQGVDAERDFICSTEKDNGMHRCSGLPPLVLTTGLVCNASALPHSDNVPTNASCVNWNQYYSNCTAGDKNPFQGSISFDNIGLAWVAIFLVISLEGWSDIMYYVQDAHSFWDWIYFVLLIVIGSFFMINLCLVVIATQFSETKKREMERMRMERARYHSSSTLASTSVSDSGCYTQIIKYLTHLGRRAKRRFLRWYRRRKRRRARRAIAQATPAAVEATAGSPISLRHQPSPPRRPTPPRTGDTHHSDRSESQSSGKPCLHTQSWRPNTLPLVGGHIPLRASFAEVFSSPNEGQRRTPNEHDCCASLRLPQQTCSTTPFQSGGVQADTTTTHKTTRARFWGTRETHDDVYVVTHRLTSSRPSPLLQEGRSLLSQYLESKIRVCRYSAPQAEHIHGSSPAESKTSLPDLGPVAAVASEGTTERCRMLELPPRASPEASDVEVGASPRRPSCLRIASRTGLSNPQGRRSTLFLCFTFWSPGRIAFCCWAKSWIFGSFCRPHGDERMRLGNLTDRSGSPVPSGPDTTAAPPERPALGRGPCGPKTVSLQAPAPPTPSDELVAHPGSASGSSSSPLPTTTAATSPCTGSTRLSAKVRALRALNAEGMSSGPNRESSHEIAPSHEASQCKDSKTPRAEGATSQGGSIFRFTGFTRCPTAHDAMIQRSQSSKYRSQTRRLTERPFSGAGTKHYSAPQLTFHSHGSSRRRRRHPQPVDSPPSTSPSSSSSTSSSCSGAHSDSSSCGEEEDDGEESWYSEYEDELSGSGSGPPKGRARGPCCRFWRARQVQLRRLVGHQYFQRGILTAILVNTLSMGIEYHDQVRHLETQLSLTNLGSMHTRSLLSFLRTTTSGLTQSDGSFILTLIPAFFILDSSLELTQSSGSGLSVLRTFRLLRILKLVRFMPALRRQLFIMLRTMDNVAVFFALLILFIFIFSVLGMNLFGCKFCVKEPDGTVQCDRKNFDSLLWALVTVFQILTQEDWNVVLFNGMEKTSPWAALYFVALMTFGNYVLFNLLVAILVEGFSAESLEALKDTADIDADGNQKYASQDAEDDPKDNIMKGRRRRLCSQRRPESHQRTQATSQLRQPRADPDPQGEPRSRDRMATLNDSMAYIQLCTNISSSLKSGCPPFTSSPYDVSSPFPLGETPVRSNLQAERQSEILNDKHIPSLCKKQTPPRAPSFREQNQAQQIFFRNTTARRQPASRARDHYVQSRDRNCGNEEWQPRASHSGRKGRRVGREATEGISGRGGYVCLREMLLSGTACCVSGPTTDKNSSVRASVGGTPRCREGVRRTLDAGRSGGTRAAPVVCRDIDGKCGRLHRSGSTTGVDRPDSTRRSFVARLVLGRRAPDLPGVGETAALEVHVGVAPYTGEQGLCWFFEPQWWRWCFENRDNHSLFIFPPESKMRIYCNRLTDGRWFDYTVLVFIALNCITLAMERPNIPPKSLERELLIAANYTFTVVFAFEMLVKVIAKGLWYGDKAYFKSGWNKMDGVLVTISLVDFFLTFVADGSPRIFGILRVFRLLRSLRPLRVINRAPGLKLVVQTLMSSLRPIGNIVLICCTFFIIFGILGVQLFKGSFYFCEGPDVKGVRTKEDCLERGMMWTNRKYNFDHLGQALMALFVLSSKDGWVNIMYSGLDAVGEGIQPVENYNEWRLLYFISFLLLVAFFVLNMFVGVVVENFHRCREEQEREERAMRAAKRARKLEKKRRKMREPPYYANYSKPRLFTHNIVTSKYFDLAIAAVIGLNVVTMAMEFYRMPLELEYALKIFNYFFTAVFLLELSMKVVALGIPRYLTDKWNQLDILIVILSIMGIVLEEMKSDLIPINPTIIRVMRVLRIARVLKLLKMAKGIRALLDTVMQALPQVGNLGLLFFLLFFIFAALGVELFGRLECDESHPCQGLGEHAHFHNFGMAFLTLFRVATGDNWNGIMKDTLRDECDARSDCVRNCCVSAIIAPLYFVVFVLMAQFVLVNVVVAVLMKHLEESHKQMDDDLDMEAELQEEMEQEERELLQAKNKLVMDAKMELHRPIVKMSSLPANFTFYFRDDANGESSSALPVISICIPDDQDSPIRSKASSSSTDSDAAGIDIADIELTTEERSAAPIDDVNIRRASPEDGSTEKVAVADLRALTSDEAYDLSSTSPTPPLDVDEDDEDSETTSTSTSKLRYLLPNYPELSKAIDPDSSESNSWTFSAEFPSSSTSRTAIFGGGDATDEEEDVQTPTTTTDETTAPVVVVAEDNNGDLVSFRP